jgi:hypothetical protein
LPVWISVSAEDDEAFGRLDEHRLADVEVAKRQLDVEVAVAGLLVRELDVEADRGAATLAGAPVRGLHHPGTPARYDRKPCLCEAARDCARGLVGLVPFAHPGGAEDRDSGFRYACDSLEAGEELVGNGVDEEAAVAGVL